MAWHLERARELDGILDAAGVDDFEALTTSGEIREVATEALEAARRSPT